jgi:F5/8 type C domain
MPRTTPLLLTCLLTTLLTAPALAADLPNLALKKTATASASEDANPPENAVDGDPGTRWCADSDATGAWWKVDLEKPQSLAGCEISWEHDTATYKFIIEGSTDNKTWITLNDQRAATETKSPQKLALITTPVRYVRITITALDDGSWASFFECKLFAADAMKSLTPDESKTYLPSAPLTPPAAPTTAPAK